MKYILLSILSFVLVPWNALAAGIQVSPEKLDFPLSETVSTQEVVVANPTADVQVYEVTADDFAKAIEFTPASFTLEAGTRKKVLVKVDQSKLNGAVATNISILGKPLAESKLQINTGVKIPVNVVAKFVWWKEQWVMIAGGIGLLVLISFSAGYIARRNKKIPT